MNKLVCGLFKALLVVALLGSAVGCKSSKETDSKASATKGEQDEGELKVDIDVEPEPPKEPSYVAVSSPGLEELAKALAMDTRALKGLNLKDGEPPPGKAGRDDAKQPQLGQKSEKNDKSVAPSSVLPYLGANPTKCQAFLKWPKHAKVAFCDVHPVGMTSSRDKPKAFLIRMRYGCQSGEDTFPCQRQFWLAPPEGQVIAIPTPKLGVLREVAISPDLSLALVEEWSDAGLEDSPVYSGIPHLSRVTLNEPDALENAKAERSAESEMRLEALIADDQREILWPADEFIATCYAPVFSPTGQSYFCRTVDGDLMQGYLWYPNVDTAARNIYAAAGQTFEPLKDRIARGLEFHSSEKLEYELWFKDGTRNWVAVNWSEPPSPRISEGGNGQPPAPN